MKLWIFLGVIVLAVIVSIPMLIRQLKAQKKHQQVEDEGEKVIVWAVGIDPALFEAGEGSDYCRPAGVLVPTNPEDGYDADYMSQLMEKALELSEKRRKPEDDERVIAKELQDFDYREGVWIKLPKSWVEGDPVYYSLMEVWRSKLPKGKARRKRRYFRAAVNFDEQELGVVHQKYDPDDEDDSPFYDRKKKKAARRDDD